jgi:hypothetical protein
MHIDPSLLWTWNRTIDRAPYVLTGILLMLVKFGLDWTLATVVFDRPWSPLNYLIWPDYAALRVLDLSMADRLFTLTLLLISLPFMWAGVMLTMHRLRAVQLPVALVVLFFVPLINLFLFFVLSLTPTRPAVVNEALPLPDQHWLQRLRAKHGHVTRGGVWKSAVVSLTISVPLTVGAVIHGANVLESYGFGLFVGAPFFLGLVSVVLFGWSQPQDFGNCMRLAFAATSLAGLAILLSAIEGVICLLMAAPIALCMTFFGALVGYSIQERSWPSQQTPTLCLGLLLLLPSLMAAEAANEPRAVLREVRTAVVIAASPERVWPHVIAFPPLAEPKDWLFRTGIAYPQRAEIRGFGADAVRYCVFSTGTFVEPIEVWEPPELLRFRVTDQPPPMHEWSPYDIYPAHLEQYLISHRGQFWLEALPDGRTRLEGTTWYTHRMWPAPYWNRWSDYIIHRIHLRVLEHIRTLAEAS